MKGTIRQIDGAWNIVHKKDRTEKRYLIVDFFNGTWMINAALEAGHNPEGREVRFELNKKGEANFLLQKPEPDPFDFW